jgi:MFS family permease
MHVLFLAALLLVGGSLGDLYGRRKIFAIGVILFGGASSWCGLAANVGQLIAARGLQGVGGALLVPGSLALISASFPSEARGRAIGTWSGFTAITAAIGPVLGGWLIQHASWRWVFFLNLPIAAVVLALTFFRVPESRNQERTHESLDWPGAVLVTVGLGDVVFALIEPSHAVIAGAVGVVSLIAFFPVEERSRAPMLSLDLFRSRNFTGANLLTLFLYTGLSGVFFFFPLDLIQGSGIHSYRSRRCTSALHLIDVRPLALVRWAGGPLWRKAAADDRPHNSRRRIRSLCKAGNWGKLLDDVLPGGCGAWVRNGCKRRAAHYNSNELGFPKSRRRRFGSQQCSLAHRGSARCRRSWLRANRGI